MRDSPAPTDRADWCAPQQRVIPQARPRRRRTSHVLTMRDGVRIAIDLHLPAGLAGERLPTILRQTRYFRAVQMRSLLEQQGLGKLFDVHARYRRTFVDAGYAWVDVDVRGTGASSGAWRTPWSEDEVRDGAEVVDFIIGQSWSNGRVGALGISYDGTASEMLLVNQHPAVRAVAPMFSLYDVFTDVAFPGGVHHSVFTAAWGEHNAALDRHDYPLAMCTPLWLMARAALAAPGDPNASRLLAVLARLGQPAFRRLIAGALHLAVAGVRGVDGTAIGTPPEAVLAQRRSNLDVHSGALQIRHRDDSGVSDELPEATIDTFSPHSYREPIQAGDVAIYSYGGWRDAAYPHAAIKRFLSLPHPGSRLILGPWMHTGQFRVHAFSLAVPSEFDHAGELLRFFDAHLKSSPTVPAEHACEPVRYYTMGEERWKSSRSWPPAGLSAVPLFLGAGRRLTAVAGDDEGCDVQAIHRELGSGERSRWRSLLGLVPGDYPDRAERDRRLLVYDSPPLSAPLEVTGHPLVAIHVHFNGEDGQLFAYLEEVAGNGRICYVTEGQLRALHRRAGVRPYPSPTPPRSFCRADAAPLAAGEVAELLFDLLPISYRFGAGSRIRLVLAGCDADHFALPPPATTTFTVHHGPGHPSRLELPVDRASWPFGST